MRDEIRAELTAIRPFDQLEREHLADALAWLDSGAALCRRAKPATPPRHLVSYFVLTDGDHLLLVDHKDAGLWLPTGGHVEPGEHPRATVARELAEELGLTPGHPIAAPLMVTCTETGGRSAGHTDVSLWYVVRGSRDATLAWDEGEFNGARWFPRDELPLGRSDPHMGRFVGKLGARFC